LDGRSFEIIGVIPSRMAFPVQRDQVDYWKTVAVDADPALYGGTIPTSRGYPRYDAAIARLKPGVTLEQSRQDMSLLAKRIAHDHPKATSSNEIAINAALDEVVGAPSRTMILILYGAVFCVLLVSCMNVANLLLVDALGRRREFSMRLALGAPAIKIVRQLLVESTMVAIAGGMAGLLVSWLVLKLFLALAPPETPRLNDIHLGGYVFFYILAVSIVGGLLFGCLPALSTRHLSLSTTLKQGDRSLTKSRSRLSASSLLICGQIILGMILTCCAAILVVNFQQILESNRGFNPHGVLTASISLPNARYGQSSQRVIDYYASLMRKLRAVPGVESAAMSEVLPLSGQSNGTTVSVVGKTNAGKPSTDLRFVDPAYFQTLQMRLLRGRPFNESDTAARPPFAIVNQAFVRAFLPDLDPLSSQIALGWGGDKARQIVGVVGDVRHSATSPATVPEVYIPFAQFPLNDMSILLRTSGDPHALTPALRKIARKLDASVPLDRVRTLDEYLLLSAAQQRFLMWLLLAFAGATMLLSAIGLYSVLSDSVLSRSREFGIRLALGSSVSRIVGLVFSQGLGVTLAAMLIGAVASVFAARLLQHWLYDANTTNPRIFGIGCLVVISVSIAACLLPARKAAHVDPVSLLRSE
jgi:putative ABC transport system permease protein